jgi:bacterioferritin
MDKQQLIDKLNEDLAGELGAIIQYLTYAAKANGPYRPQLVSIYLAEVPDETGHAQFLSNKIVALGGEPTTVPAPTPAAATNKEMLERVREAERGAIKNYTERAQQAEDLNEKGLQVQLEDMILDETGHFEEIDRMLKEWPL